MSSGNQIVIDNFNYNSALMISGTVWSLHINDYSGIVFILEDLDPS